MVNQLSFIARWGSACGIPFDVKAYLARHMRSDCMEGLLKDSPAEPWNMFKADKKK